MFATNDLPHEDRPARTPIASTLTVLFTHSKHGCVAQTWNNLRTSGLILRSPRRQSILDVSTGHCGPKRWRVNV